MRARFSKPASAVAGAAGSLLVVVATSSPAVAAAPNLPDPCKLLTVTQINTALNKSGAHPHISRTTYQSGTAYETRTCTWTYGATTVNLNIYDKSGGSGGGPSKITPEPSLGPNGALRQSTSANYPSTSVSFTRHGHNVGIYVNRSVAPRRMVALGKDAYNRT